MRSSSALLAALTLCLVAWCSSAAHAAISWQAVSVPITATTDAVTPSPGIAGYQCFDITVTVTAGDPNRVASIYFNPPTGPIFEHALGNNSQAANFGPPFAPFIPAFPVLEFDSYLQSFSGGQLSVIGARDQFTETPGPGTFNSDLVGVVVTDFWDGTLDGTFRLARFTFQGNVIFPIVEFRVPEPAALGAAGIAVSLVALRPRRCSS